MNLFSTILRSVMHLVVDVRARRAVFPVGSQVEGAGETVGSRRARACTTKEFSLLRLHGEGSS